MYIMNSQVVSTAANLYIVYCANERGCHVGQRVTSTASDATEAMQSQPNVSQYHLFMIDCIDQFLLLCDFRFGILPYRKPIHVVVGAPIEVERIEYPSKEDIEELHARYVEELTKLYDIYNPIYGDVNIKLVID